MTKLKSTGADERGCFMSHRALCSQEQSEVSSIEALFQTMQIMEETRINGKNAAVCMPHDANECKLIAICDAASIGVMKAIKDLGISLDELVVKDLKSDAVYAALTHVKPEAKGALSYADKCGRTSVLNMLRRNSYSFGRKVISFDMAECCSESIADDSSADGILLRKEEDKAQDRMLDFLRISVQRLSETDKALYRLCLQGMKYGDIARKLGCSEGTARKRALDMRNRIRRSMESMCLCAA